MDEQALQTKSAEEQLNTDLKGVYKKARKNMRCLYPGCSAPPIHSHIIARETLRLIAEESHVLTWLPLHISPWEMAKDLHAGVPWEQRYEKPVPIGISEADKATNLLFCESHDQSLFRPLENTALTLEPEQVLLLAYRALSSMNFRRLGISAIDAVIEVAKKHNYYHTLSEPERYARLQRFFANDVVGEVYRQHEALRVARDYNQLGYSVYSVNMPPCIAATYGFMSTHGDEAQAIVNGTQAMSADNFMSFTFLPHKTLNQSICVISWLRGSRRAQRFLLLSGINELSEKEQQDLLLSLAFRSPTIYIAPTWWRSLREEKREEYQQIHSNANRKYAALV
jgi:hypothetical protein